MISGHKPAEKHIDLGGNRLIGQHAAREKLGKALQSGRLGHAYLFAGPAGTGKKALALALAEAVNGIDHLSDLKSAGTAVSSKRSWYLHPDIHVFLPLPSRVSMNELSERVKLLAGDPYEIVDFSLRPSLTDQEDPKNRQAFYSMEYFREQIRPVSFLKPNEGSRTVVLISNIEKMKVQGFNAFLKLLEEPADRVMYLLTTDRIDAVLPTVVSRCQVIQCTPLNPEEIRQGLIRFEKRDENDADYLSRIANGNYSLTRFYKADNLKTDRNRVVDFFRFAFTRDAKNIIAVSRDWHSDHNLEGRIALMNIMETFLRDVRVYSAARDASLITNVGQIDVISKFCSSLSEARLDDMIAEVAETRRYLYQNVNPKMLYTVLANRFSALMRGRETATGPEPWQHVPATRFS